MSTLRLRLGALKQFKQWRGHWNASITEEEVHWYLKHLESRCSLPFRPSTSCLGFWSLNRRSLDRGASGRVIYDEYRPPPEQKDPPDLGSGQSIGAPPNKSGTP
eukprot:6216696-Amphidinium_carterae.1